MGFFEQAKEMGGALTAIRRRLHAQPELGRQEKETQAFVIRELKGIGIEVVTYPGQYAVVGILGGRPGQGCVALRADMDALPICENTGLPFASQAPGVMHACGHDAHMAIALGAARLLAGCREQWQGTVKFFFEPDEEGHGGSQDMVAQGCLEGVQAVLGLHMNPDYPAGTVFSRPGCVSGASNGLTLRFMGKGCHGAYPERGVDAIAMAAQAITALQTLVSRNVSPLDSAVLSLGTIHGGTAGNVICQEVSVRGTLRTLRPATRQLMKERIPAVCQGIAQAMGGACQVEIREGYGAVYNDGRLHGFLEKEVAEHLGADKLVPRPVPSLGVESFSFFVEKLPGLYYDLGCGIGTALHTETFQVDEACLPIGAALQAALALDVLKS